MRPFLAPALLLLLLPACSGEASRGSTPESPCRQQSFEGSRFTVCDGERAELRLFAAGKDEKPLRSFPDLMQRVRADRVGFAMNAGMFDEDGRPIGLAIVDGKQLHKINRRGGGGNFGLLPNGVFVVGTDGAARVVESGRFDADEVRYATQSGPMLVIDGKLHPKFDSDGTSRYIRNGVGVTSAGAPLFVISQDPVSFGKFARFFRDELKTPNALYFDGSVSSLWDPANGRMDTHSPLGPIIVAFKPAASAPDREGRAKP